MRLFIASIAVLASLMMGPTGAATGQEGGPIAVGEVVERLDPAAQISGAAVAGLALMGQIDPAANVIEALVPRRWHGSEFCATVISADGRYLAQRTFRAPDNWVSNIVALEFPTRLSREISWREQHDIGLAVTLGVCGPPGPVTAVVPALWNRGADSNADLELLVNSRRANETYLIVGPESQVVMCVGVGHERRTAFDASCTIPASALPKGQSISVELNRITRGSPMPSEFFTIELD